MTLLLAATDPEATIAVNGMTLLSKDGKGQPRVVSLPSLALFEGSNVVTVTVTALDMSTRTYLVRPAATISPTLVTRVVTARVSHE